MKRFILISTILTLIISSLTGCDVWPFCGGDDSTVSEDRDIPDFTGITLEEEDAYITFSQSGDRHCNITCPKNTLTNLETNVIGNILNIDAVSCVAKHKDIKISLNCPALISVSVLSNGGFTMAGPLSADELKLEMSGSGKIDIEELSANSVKAAVSGSGNINIGGSKKLKSLEIIISGSGSVNAFNLPAENISVNISGSGSCRIYPEAILNGKISGSGNIYYRGKPSVNVDKTGSGEAIKKY